MSLKINNIPDLLLKDHPLNGVERVSYFKGWILSLWDHTILIKDEKQDTSFYVRTQDIVKKLCDIPKAPVGIQIDSTQTELQRLVVKNINPVIGSDLTLEKVAHFFHEFRSKDFIDTLRSSKNDLEASAYIINRLEQFLEKDITVIPFSKSALLEHLQPGDIIFRKLEVNKKSIVIFGQKLIAPFIRGKKEREGYNFSHVLIYLGNGKVAEAYEGCRIVRKMDMSHPSFTLKPSSTRQYCITRLKDQVMAREAAQIASSLAKDPEEDTGKPLRYDYLLALQSLFHTPDFGPFARYRYLKHYIDGQNNELSVGFFERKSFFCSYFVPYCYQIAESRTLMKRLLPKDDTPSEGRSRFDTAVRRGLWAHIRSWKLWNTMSDHIRFKLDVKRTTPHELRNFVVKNPNLFQDLYLVKAPS